MTLVQIGEPMAAGRSTSVPPAYHIVRGNPPMLYVAEGSRLYALGGASEVAATDELGALVSILAGGRPEIRFEDQPTALSLNIAQACNLACSYCYADEGRFGGDAQLMSIEIAKQAIDSHLRRSVSRSASIGFIGGEPLLNRPVLHESVAYAASEAARLGVRITFGITTNGVLLSPADIALLRAYPFAVTVSVDGTREAHDALRTTRSGAPSFDGIMKRVAPLLSNPGLAKVAARVTLTRLNLDVSACVDSLARAGFAEIGVSPLRTGPNPSLRLEGDDWGALLDAMKAAAACEWTRVKDTQDAIRFSNFATALKQLYRGACDALPCRSAAGYVSLSAEGRYYTCHRTVGDASCDVGDIASGPSAQARRQFLEHHHVDEQEPCRTCWARYLCGGGCHAEVLQAGRSGCDYIRGWLEYCISLYPQILLQRPDLVGAVRMKEEAN
jgi:uncharacterized protein